MARPSRDTIQSGVNGWDATTNDNFIRLYDRPLAIHEHVGDESDLASTFAAASYDNCIVWVNHTVDGWVPYHSDGSTWEKLFIRFASDFTSLPDTPSSYSGESLKLVRVNVGETALEFTTPPAGTFLGLTDVAPSTFVGQASKIVAVNVGETALEFVVAAAATTFLGLSDAPASYSGEANKVVSVNVGETALEFTTPAAGTTTFLGLTDAPASYSSQANKVVSVNSGETALEFTTPAAGGGAMTVETPATTATIGGTENTIAVCSGTSYTVTLPSASSAGAGHRIIVKRVSSGTITVDGDSADTIDSVATFALSVALSSISLVSDGTSNWWLV